jgi:hypothetical protein
MQQVKSLKDLFLSKKIKEVNRYKHKIERTLHSFALQKYYPRLKTWKKDLHSTHKNNAKNYFFCR